MSACLGKYAPEAQPLLAAKKEEANGRSPARIFTDYMYNAALMTIPAVLVLVVTACVCLGLGYDLPRITGGGDLPRLEFPEPMVGNPPGDAAPTAAVIFLHGLGGHAEGTDGVGIAANLIKLPGVKWVFPDAPTMPVTVEGGKNIPSVRLFLLILVWAIRMTSSCFFYHSGTISIDSQTPWRRSWMTNRGSSSPRSSSPASSRNSWPPTGSHRRRSSSEGSAKAAPWRSQPRCTGWEKAPTSAGSSR